MKFKHVLAIAIIATVVFLGVVIVRHVLEAPSLDEESPLPANVDIALTDLHYSHNEDGVKQWSLDADQAEYQRQDGLAQLDHIQLNFFAASAFSEVVLTAEHGTFDQNNQVIKVWDQVVVTTDRGDRLTLDQLRYEQKSRQLYSDGPVSYRSPQLLLSGQGLHLDVENGVMKILHQVKATLNSPSDRSKN